jgi:triphosphoribosyl-dephospho-CoA synthase
MNLSLGSCVQKSIELECSAPKLGNVFPGHPFEDMTHDSFLDAAKAIGECVDRLYSDLKNDQNVAPGYAILRCTQAMLQSAGCNTSLGTILLAIPLIESFARVWRAANQHRSSLEEWQNLLAEEVLQKLTAQDSAHVYDAIRICNPGGLGSKPEMDVASAPPVRLLDAMAFASHYDDVALQYVSRFELCFALAKRLSLYESSGKNASILESITLLQLELLAERPDSLIARKGGSELAEQVREKAHKVLSLWAGQSTNWLNAWQELDDWMRSLRNSQGKRIANPGTHADLIAAAILIYLLLHKPNASDSNESSQ